MLRRIAAILGFDASTALGRIKEATLIMADDDETVVPCYCGEALLRAIPGAERKLFPCGGHCFNSIIPRESTLALQRFPTANTPAGQRGS